VLSGRFKCFVHLDVICQSNLKREYKVHITQAHEAQVALVNLN